MKCIKCNYDLGEPEPNYCPNCGKKVPKIKPDTTVPFRNADYWCYIGLDAFKEDWRYVKTLDAEKAFRWLMKEAPKQTIYTIETIRKDWSDRSRVVSASSLENLLWYYTKWQGGTIITAYPTEATLTRKYSPNKYGKSWWWTKEDCLKAIKDLQARVNAFQKQDVSVEDAVKQAQAALAKKE